MKNMTLFPFLNRLSRIREELIEFHTLASQPGYRPGKEQKSFTISKLSTMIECIDELKAELNGKLYPNARPADHTP